MLSLLLLLVLQSPAAGAAEAIPGKGSPRVTIPRIETTVSIDGVLDESAWSQAVRLGGFSQYQPADSRPAEERTDVLVWYGPDAIYFGVIAYDSQPSSVRATVADRDNLDRDDNISIYLDTFNDRRRAFVFGVNPLGSQQDGVQNEGQFNPGTFTGMGGGGGMSGLDKNPDYRFESKGRLTEDGYVVEIRIPFKSLRYPSSGTQTWGLNVKRKIQRTGYEDTWTDAKRVASFLAQSGTIDGLHDLKRGVVVEAQPFVTASSSGAREEDGTFARAADASGGANLRVGFTNMSVDGTLNPDFSQVESDAGLITINQRFALFIPEKRPFFLEGIELFATPNQLVYTRQVVDPVAGGKLTGKFGAFGVAHMTAVDDTGGGHALFNVTRIRRDLGGNSVAGVTYTDRSGDGSFNRVLAADARIVFGGLYYVLGQVGRSWTDGRSGRAPVWTAEFDRTARHWGFNYKLNGIGDEFESRAGFVPRNNMVEFRAMNRLTYYGARGTLFENATVFFGPSRIWRYGAFGHDAPIEGNESVSTNLTLRGGWLLSNNFRREFVQFDPALYGGYAVVRGGGVQQYDRPEKLTGELGWTSSITTPTWRKANGKIEMFRGGTAIFPEAAAGHERRWTVSAAARPTTSVRIDLSVVRSSLFRNRNESEFARTTLPRLKVEYQPRRSLFFRAVSEYRAQRQAALEHAVTGEPLLVNGVGGAVQQQKGLRVDWLASFEPTPGTAAYFGYGSVLEVPESWGSHRFRRANDGFFLKLAYQVRR